MLPFAPLARSEGELPVGGVECATIGEVVISIVYCDYRVSVDVSME